MDVEGLWDTRPRVQRWEDTWRLRKHHKHHNFRLQFQTQMDVSFSSLMRHHHRRKD